MYCVECGRKLNNDNKFCPQCGTAVAPENRGTSISQSPKHTPTPQESKPTKPVPKYAAGCEEDRLYSHRRRQSSQGKGSDIPRIILMVVFFILVNVLLKKL